LNYILYKKIKPSFLLFKLWTLDTVWKEDSNLDSIGRNAGNTFCSCPWYRLYSNKSINKWHKILTITSISLTKMVMS